MNPKLSSAYTYSKEEEKNGNRNRQHEVSESDFYVL
jgi:hypothetical protein